MKRVWTLAALELWPILKFAGTTTDSLLSAFQTCAVGYIDVVYEAHLGAVEPPALVALVSQRLVLKSPPQRLRASRLMENCHVMFETLSRAELSVAQCAHLQLALELVQHHLSKAGVGGVTHRTLLRPQVTRLDVLTAVRTDVFSIYLLVWKIIFGLDTWRREV